MFRTRKKHACNIVCGVGEGFCLCNLMKAHANLWKVPRLLSIIVAKLFCDCKVFLNNLLLYLLNKDFTMYEKHSGFRNYESWGCLKIRNILPLLAKKCSTLVESAGTKVSPSRCLQNQASVVGDVCTFSCTAGYELPSSVNTLACLTTGSWNGSVINCQSK